MSQAPGQLIDDGSPRLYLAATEPLWIGAVKRAARRLNYAQALGVEEVANLRDIPPAKRGGCQLVYVEVARGHVEEVVAWLTARRPLAAASRVVAMVSRAECEFSAAELCWATQWLREAGASHVVASVWELPAVFDAMQRVALARHQPDPWSSLPLPLQAEGWQPHHRGDRF